MLHFSLESRAFNLYVVKSNLMKNISPDTRKHPELYRIGQGDEGALTYEPYKSELLPLLRFKSPTIAKESAANIHRMFVAYKKDSDFVGMDMARKYLQMGLARARTYSQENSEFAEAAKLFREVSLKAKRDPYYIVLKAKHQRLFER